jgi:hypothetical protein
MSSSVIAQAQAQLAAIKSQQQQQQQNQQPQQQQNPAVATSKPLVSMPPQASMATSAITTMAAIQSPQLGSLPLAARSLSAATIPTLTLQQAQAYQQLAAAGSLTDPYLGQGIGPIAGYQNPLYRRFAPY